VVKGFVIQMEGVLRIYRHHRTKNEFLLKKSESMTSFYSFCSFLHWSM